MAKASVADWSSNADQNTDIGGINIDEGCPPSGINNAIRGIMAQVAAYAVNVIRSGAGVTNDWLGAKNLRANNGSTIYDTLATPAERLVGYRNLPMGAQQSAAYTIALTDNGMAVPISTGGVTILASGTVAFGSGDLVIIYNNGSASQSITPASGVTLTLAGTSSTGTRALAQNGLATLLRTPTTDSWLIYGIGVG